jgi:hypothetical protein
VPQIATGGRQTTDDRRQIIAPESVHHIRRLGVCGFDVADFFSIRIDLP